MLQQLLKIVIHHNNDRLIFVLFLGAMYTVNSLTYLLTYLFSCRLFFFLVNSVTDGWSVGVVRFIRTVGTAAGAHRNRWERASIVDAVDTLQSSPSCKLSIFSTQCTESTSLTASHRSVQSSPLRSPQLRSSISKISLLVSQRFQSAVLAYCKCSFNIQFFFYFSFPPICYRHTLIISVQCVTDKR